MTIDLLNGQIPNDLQAILVPFFQGPVGPAAETGWISYAGHWDTAPTAEGATAEGTVYSYTLEGVTRYRLVPSPYDPALDAFYENFDGTTLSDFIVSRGVAA